MNDNAAGRSASRQTRQRVGKPTDERASIRPAPTALLIVRGQRMAPPPLPAPLEPHLALTLLRQQTDDACPGRSRCRMEQGLADVPRGRRGLRPRASLRYVVPGRSILEPRLSARHLG